MILHFIFKHMLMGKMYLMRFRNFLNDKTYMLGLSECRKKKGLSPSLSKIKECSIHFKISNEKGLT